MTYESTVPEVSPPAPPRDHPNDELPAVDPRLFEEAKAAVRALRTAGRAPSGRFTPGNGARLTHGLRSTRLLELPDVRTWHTEQVAAIGADLGGEPELSALQRAAVREAARLEVLAAAIGDDLLERGCLSAKGKTRAALTAYLSLIDRLHRMATTLGLARREKPVIPSLADLVAPAALSAPQTPPTTPDTPAPAPMVDRVPAPAPAAPSATFGDEC
ncbi:MAG: hypothetical protein KJ066_16275 [Acidobacteria bacterium]|nr:hypothetical protein [Acidobacteriota bacterium]